MRNGRAALIEMLKTVVALGATDLHLSVGVPPYVRVNGEIQETDFPSLSIDECENMLFALLNDSQKSEYDRNKVIDFSFGDAGVGRFRVNIYQQRGTIAGAIRILPLTILPLEQLGLPVEPIKQFCGFSNGLILVCGPVGAGKTTTLASMIDYINRTRGCHIISIEDPIEYVHSNCKSLIHQREVRKDTENFNDALKYILREDPDVVIIGEMRDMDTITAALNIAETGHLVLATLHTGDASESIRRIVDVFPQGQQSQIVAQLSYMLLGVVNQLLVPSLEYGKRVLASEVMVVTVAIQNLIRENKIEQIYSHIQIGSGFGMHTMNESLFELVQRGAISRNVAITQTKRTKEFMKLLESLDA